MTSTSNLREIPSDIADSIELREGGRLFWRVSTRRTRKGDEATARHNAGYLCVGFKGEVYLAHRVVFFLANGWVPSLVDHIDGDKTNNDPGNLREASRSINGLNRKPASKNSSSGRRGVFWVKRASKWGAEITVDGKTKSLGRYPCLIDAVAARMRAEREAACI